MTTTILVVSIIIKALTFLMVLYTFSSIAKPEVKNKNVGVVTKYYVMKRRYNLLKGSLLFVAAIAVLELISMIYGLTSSSPNKDIELLVSDIIFLGLVILLTRIYNFRENFAQALKDAVKDSKLKKL